MTDKYVIVYKDGDFGRAEDKPTSDALLKRLKSISPRSYEAVYGASFYSGAACRIRIREKTSSPASTLEPDLLRIWNESLTSLYET